MARKATKATAAKADTGKASAKDEPKYTVTDLVEASGLQAESVRVALRDLRVEKQFGNKYGWNTKKDFDEIVKGLKERSAKRIGATKDEKPAAKPKKGRAKKAA